MTVIGGRYEVKGSLGQPRRRTGGDGPTREVYCAFDTRVERPVAIKWARRPPKGNADAQEAYKRLRLEACVMGKLSHPNIVAVHDCDGGDEAAEEAWIVMELVEGGSLKNHLASLPKLGTCLPVPEIVRIMKELLAALDHAHGRGVVHRDVKPDNLLLTSERHVKLADFGSARVENLTDTLLWSPGGALIGTPPYMAPEQWERRPANRQTDIWSAGVVLYELLTGGRPFQGDDQATIERGVLKGEPLAPSLLSEATPPALDEVVARALAKKPEDRFGSAADFAQEIQAAAAPPGLPPPPPPGPDRNSTRRVAVALGAGGAAGIAAGMLAAALLLVPSDPDKVRSIELRDENVRAERRLGELGQAAGAAERQVQDFRDAAAAAEAELASRRDAATAATTNLATATRAAEEAASRLRAMEARAAELARGVAAGEQRLQDLRKQAAAAERRLTERAASLDGASARLAEATVRVRGLEARAAELTSVVGSTEGRLAQLRDAMAEAERGLTVRRAALEKAEAERAHAVAARDAAETALRSLEARAAELNKNLGVPGQRGRAEDRQTLTMPDGAYVRAAPGSDPVVGTVKRGARVWVFAQSDEWLQVGDEQKALGWVYMGRFPGWQQRLSPPAP